MDSKICEKILNTGEISTDTRTQGAGGTFFALKGENHDAHDHLDAAVAKGAVMLVVSDAGSVPPGYKGEVVVVDDVLRAYQDLAAYHRKKLDPLVIAVTGSVGKTTLKDMIACILSPRFRVCHTKGNLNNMIGLPRTILEADSDTEIMVLEMGMACPGEIERLADIARPDICAITNIGIAHRENFNSDLGILNAKFEITSYLDADGVLVINAGDSTALERLAEAGSLEKGYKVLRVASSGTEVAEQADYIATSPGIRDEDPSITFFEISGPGRQESACFQVPAPGAYAGLSAAMATAVCACAGVSLRSAALALKGLERTAHRLEVIRTGGMLLIDDTYNASPDSAKAGLEYLADVPAARRIAVLADMNELGGETIDLHSGVGAAAYTAGVDLLFVYGTKAQWIADGAAPLKHVFRFEPDEKIALIEELREIVGEGDAVYVKGSRSMKMEEVVLALGGGRI